MITKKDLIEAALLIGSPKSKFYVNAYLEGFGQGMQALKKVHLKRMKKEKSKQKIKDDEFVKWMKRLSNENE